MQKCWKADEAGTEGEGCLVASYYKAYRKKAEESYIQLKWQELFRVGWLF